jgi:hypothetical protein
MSKPVEVRLLGSKGAALKAAVMGGALNRYVDLVATFRTLLTQGCDPYLSKHRKAEALQMLNGLVVTLIEQQELMVFIVEPEGETDAEDESNKVH